MKIAMALIGLASVLIGLMPKLDHIFIIGHIWLVGSILFGELTINRKGL